MISDNSLFGVPAVLNGSFLAQFSFLATWNLELHCTSNLFLQYSYVTYFNLILYKPDNPIGNCSVTSHLYTWWLTIIIYKSTAEVGGSPLSSLMQILSAAEEAGSSAERGWAVTSLGFSWLLVSVPQLFVGAHSPAGSLVLSKLGVGVDPRKPQAWNQHTATSTTFF